MPLFSSNAQKGNIKLICKPEQSGKTFVVLQQIVANTQLEIEGGINIVNIIFCDNNLMLTQQTGNRVGQALEAIIVEGTRYVEFSSNSSSNHRSSNDVLVAIYSGIHNILCCTNGRRVNDIKTIIDRLNIDANTAGKYVFKIWLDEADKCIDAVMEFDHLMNIHPNIQLYCITATPKKLFHEFGSLNVIPLENTTSENYHGWNDNDLRKYDTKMGCEEFIGHILNSDSVQDQITPGTKWLIPAEFKKSSHEAVRDICIDKGFAVIIVNGKGITLTFPDRRYEEVFLKNDELNTILKEIYTKHSLHKYPLAITGNICIARGISIMSSDFILDYGILSLCSNQQEASQSAGRLKGNMKGWANYKKPIVYTTTKFAEVATTWEEKSRELAVIAFAKEQSGKSAILTEEEHEKIGYVQGAERVPTIIECDPTHQLFTEVSLDGKPQKLSRKEKENYIKSQVEKNPLLANLLSYINDARVSCTQVSKPTTESSYKKHIIDSISAADRNKDFNVDLKKEKKHINGWQCFVDEREGRLIILQHIPNPKLLD